MVSLTILPNDFREPLSKERKILFAIKKKKTSCYDTRVTSWNFRNPKTSNIKGLRMYVSRNSLWKSFERPLIYDRLKYKINFYVKCSK